MNWLDLLKKPGICPEPHPTKTTKVVSVVSVGSPPAHFDGKRSSEAPLLVAPGVKDDENLRPEVAPQPDLTGDPDAYCWPASSAMNGAEIVTFMGRAARFTDRGMGLSAAEDLADRLVKRDRDLDDRRTCMECRNMRRNGGCAVAHLAMPIGAVPLPLQRCGHFLDAGATWH